MIRMVGLGLLTGLGIVGTPLITVADAHTQGHSMPGHGHGTMNVPPGQPIPTLSLEITPDPKKGYNLHLKTTNFRFAPEEVNTAGNTSSGHAHLYVNGKQIARVYSAYYHIFHLQPGRNEIRVTLNANNHDEIAVDGKPIAASVVIDVPAK